jgi:hypothetical protein
MQLHRLAGIALTIFLSGCSTQVNDAFRKIMDSLSLQSQSAITLVSNTTTESPKLCESGNQVVLQRSAALGRKLYCREKAKLAEGLTVGEFCPGGVNIGALAVSEEIKECSEMTLCGVPASAVMAVSQRADGGTIDELRFSNLPWGCETDLQYSVDSSFTEQNVTTLKIIIQPSECPFCPRQNKVTCLPCRDLDSDEEIKSGQVIRKCTGAACRSCSVLGLSGQTVPHGEGRLYYQQETGFCDQKCSSKSLMRVCNDGLWEGDPSYSFSQCFDVACGCTLPGDPVSYAHRDTKIVYKSREPACGVKCADEDKLLACNDGVWESGTPATAVPAAELALYPAKTCSEKVCHCLRTNRMTVAENQTKTVYSKNPVSCTEKCSDFAGDIKCEAGTLTATNPAFLQYAHDSCMQEDCGCRVELDDGKFNLLTNGGMTTVYRYAQNSNTVPDACTNPAYRVNLSCNNRVLAPAYDKAVFKFATCQEVPLSCEFTASNGNKTTVQHLANLDVTVTSTPRCAEACQNLQITCDNRVFKKMVNGSLVAIPAAELATYKEAAICTPKNCSCNVNGNIMAFGAVADNFYSTDKITNCNLNGCEQARTTITCTENGPVTSNGTPAANYRFRSCEVVLCECATPWGGSIENGKTVKVFGISQATCSNRNACDAAANFKSITCNNGTLTPYNTQTYPFYSCAPPICECSIADRKVPFGDKIVAYKSDKAPDGELCESISKELTCNPGGTWTGGEVSDYPFVGCTDLNDSGTGGGTGGGTGNDEGPGAGIKRRIGLPDPDGGPGGGGPCLSLSGCRVNIVSPASTFTEKLGCVLPWGGGEMEYLGSVSAFDTLCVTGPDRCSKHRIVRTCHQLGLTGPATHKYPSCQEKSSCP